MRVGQNITITEGFPVNDGFNSKEFDKSIYRLSMKRISPIRLRQGVSGDDFVRCAYTVSLTAEAMKIPRILNAYKRRGKLFTPKTRR